MSDELIGIPSDVCEMCLRPFYPMDPTVSKCDCNASLAEGTSGPMPEGFKVKMGEEKPSIESRITEYLSVGGLFNPEMMDHERVRDLIMDCRTELLRLNQFIKIRDDMLVSLCEEKSTAENLLSAAGTTQTDDSDWYRAVQKFLGGGK